MALAATFDTGTSINGNTVSVTSTLTSGPEGSYRRTVTVSLQGGGQESQNDVKSYALTVAVPGSFQFSGTVASFVSVEYDSMP